MCNAVRSWWRRNGSTLTEKLIPRANSRGPELAAYAGLWALLLANLASVVYFVQYTIENGYAPSPFIFDKSDTMMDLFNPLYWAFDDGRYTEWLSVYPPLNFIILQILAKVFLVDVGGDPHLLREASAGLVAGFVAAYFILPLLIIKTATWQNLLPKQRLMLYLICVLSSAMLFTLERGNLIMLAPPLLAVALADNGMRRILAIAVLVNLKPYFAVLMICYLATRNIAGFLLCAAVTALLFFTTGLLLDENFLQFFPNIFNFSGTENLFSLKDMLSFPTTLATFSQLLSQPETARTAAQFLESDLLYERSESIAIFIDVVRLGILASAVMLIIYKGSWFTQRQAIAMLTICISNLGMSVGGYTVILYFALIPVLVTMKLRNVYLVLVATLALPLDLFSIQSTDIGPNYSYLSDNYVSVDWTLALGAVIRPLINFALLLAVNVECLLRHNPAAEPRRVESQNAGLRSQFSFNS